MSGGVDSSVAAVLLQRAGWEVVGMTAELFGDASAAGPCCGREGSGLARAVCSILGVEHHHVDLTELFERTVIDRFIGEYRAGRTPNPCSDCNRFIKFDTFFETARELGCDYVATGHHARIAEVDGRWLLKTAVDANKDQTYFLACIEPQRLSQIRFPVGEMDKREVRRIAQEARLPTARRDESQDICFISNGMGIAELLDWHTGDSPQPGRIVTEDGTDLGEHPGIEHFTIGQRRGLKLGGGTEGLVVHRLEPRTRRVVVAGREAHPVRALHLRDFTDMAPGLWRPGEEIMLRGRYRQELWPGRASIDGDCVSVAPAGELYSMSSGQWCAGYRGDTVLFGGIIDGIEYAS